MLTAEFRQLPARVKRELWAMTPDAIYLLLGWGVLTLKEVTEAIGRSLAEGRRVIEEEGIEAPDVDDPDFGTRLGFRGWAHSAYASESRFRTSFWMTLLEREDFRPFDAFSTVFDALPNGSPAKDPRLDFMVPPPPEEVGLTLPPLESQEGYSGKSLDYIRRVVVTELNSPGREALVAAYTQLRDRYVEWLQRPLEEILGMDEEGGDWKSPSEAPFQIEPGADLSVWVARRAALYINAHDFEQGRYYEDWPTPIEEGLSILGGTLGRTPEEDVRAIAEALTKVGNPDRLRFRVKRYRADGPNLPVALREEVAEQAGLSRTQAGEYLKRSGFELPRDLLFTLKKR